MKTSEELIAIKMCIKTFSVKVKRIENINKQLKKMVFAKNLNNENSQPENRKSGFTNGYDIERRVLNLISRE